ncbi:salicylate synthase [Lysobacter sp. ISL-50]|uniref:salicylate synthase n=1 Tax=unclassified Lysobacter TaxID=2635362 RepID=UPI001BED04B9|nr:salicylate synthase [Lysobacter sp. ISL-42]MBT2751653.1 salicylate synthase [Lysobacter sp. ISL-50]MBT2775847.1 salicylate synthase [Lysobacter sp. ISL-54]MBT2782189.1 salicylate synthase [Lysobacter sp. ISL-52]
MSDANGLEIAERLLSVLGRDQYCAYERDGKWHVGLGATATLAIGPGGDQYEVASKNGVRTGATNAELASVARQFMAEHAPSGRRVYGQVAFNYAPCVNGQPYTPGTWPLLILMVPRVDVMVTSGTIEVCCDDEAELDEVVRVVSEQAIISLPTPCPIETHAGEVAYQEIVRTALGEIGSGFYEKIIVSRAVATQERIDMPASLALGRRRNTPARAFALKFGSREAVGFSPELIMSVDGGIVSTEPLAGTRAKSIDPEADARNRQELVNDPKEIVEHAISVREAVDELMRICVKGTVAVNDFMSVRNRGSVQHLGSRVSGQLNADADAWDALDVLFPSITATGIPKRAAIAAIGRLEASPRELYSGAVLMIEGERRFEAALVLRAVYQDATRSWVQAGAGIIAQSNPHREFIETVEKLGSVAPYLAMEPR